MPNAATPKGWFALTLVMLVITGVWGIVLPALAKTDVVQQREAFLEANRIDPAAMFYTELECLETDT